MLAVWQFARVESRHVTADSLRQRPGTIPVFLPTSRLQIAMSTSVTGIFAETETAVIEDVPSSFKVIDAVQKLEPMVRGKLSERLAVPLPDLLNIHQLIPELPHEAQLTETGNLHILFTAPSNGPEVTAVNVPLLEWRTLQQHYQTILEQQETTLSRLEVVLTEMGETRQQLEAESEARQKEQADIQTQILDERKRNEECFGDLERKNKELEEHLQRKNMELEEHLQRKNMELEEQMRTLAVSGENNAEAIEDLQDQFSDFIYVGPVDRNVSHLDVELRNLLDRAQAKIAKKLNLPYMAPIIPSLAFRHALGPANAPAAQCLKGVKELVKDKNIELSDDALMVLSDNGIRKRADSYAHDGFSKGWYEEATASNVGYQELLNFVF
ncbi:hypothetical protein C8J56DRAFT_496124 [Mycena floridula]|nr:hypothetical protein C8J56DRAFT_496124 [Mycena floridula]